MQNTEPLVNGRDFSNSSLKEKNELINHNKFSDIQDRAIEAFNNSKELGAQAVDRSVELAKKYPVHSALSAGAIGAIAGFIFAKIIK